MGIEAAAIQDARVAIAVGLTEHSAVLLAAARLITLNDDEAEDVVQTTFELALRKAHTLREPRVLRAWLLAIAAREAVRRVRLLRRWVTLVPQVHDIEQPGPSADSIALHACLGKLPRRVRAAIVLHYMAGYSVNETAHALGVSENTIKTQLKTGLVRLREELCDE